MGDVLIVGEDDVRDVIISLWTYTTGVNSWIWASVSFEACSKAAEVMDRERKGRAEYLSFLPYSRDLDKCWKRELKTPE